MILVPEFNSIYKEVYEVESFDSFRENKILKHKHKASGIGVNIAKHIKSLHAEPYLYCIAGGFSGRYIRNEVLKRKIKSDFTWSKRESNIVTEIKKGDEIIKLQSDDYIIEETVGKQFINKIRNNTIDASSIVFAGNLPTDIDYSAFTKLILDIKRHNTKIVLNYKDENSRRVLEENPYLVKIKYDDLHLLSINADNMNDSILVYLKNGIKYFVVEHENFILFYSKNIIFKVEHNSKRIDFDELLLSGIMYSIDKKYEFEKLAKIAAAMTCISKNEIVSQNTMQRHYKKVKVDIINIKEEVKEMLGRYCNV